MKSFIVLLAVSLISTSVNAARVPYSHSLVRRNIQVPPTLLEKKDTLVVRQATCGAEATCTGGGCCDGQCCGDGCCPAGYTCYYVGTTPACCAVGQVCNDTISGCTDSSLSECPAPYDFCCPTGQACSQDGAGNAQCNGVTVGNGNGNSNPNTAVTSSSSQTFSQINTNVGGNNGNNNGNNNNNGGVSTPSSNQGATTVFANSPSSTTKAGILSQVFHGNGAEKYTIGSVVGVLAAVMVGLAL